MRKWMRDRLKRRKRTDAGTSQEESKAPQPLQPKYFEDQSAEPEPQMAGGESEPQEQAAESRRSGEPKPQAASDAAGTQRRPSRRRRGRGGRGRKSQPQPSASASVTAAAPPVTSEPSIPPEPPPEPIFASPEPVLAATEPPAAAVHATKGTVVLAIGLPGSGKSSWFKRHNIRPLSSDLLRQLLFDDAEEQRFQDLVFSNLRSMLKARLIARRPLNYVDATNLTPHDRRNWIKLATDFGYEVQAVFFDVPLEVCVDRNRKRERVVSDEVMRRMAAKLKPPTFEEGFSKITVVRVKKKDDIPAD